MSKVTAFTLSTLRNEEILGMSLEIAEKLKNVKSVADSTQGKAFLDAIPTYASALDLEKTLTYKDLVQADAAVDQAITVVFGCIFRHCSATRKIWNAICARAIGCAYTPCALAYAQSAYGLWSPRYVLDLRSACIHDARNNR